MKMSELAVVAVSKAVSKAAYAAASEKVLAGSYPVSFTVKVEGVVTKGEDYTQKIVAKADPWLLLAAALSKLNGVTVAALVREAESAPADLVDGLKAQAATAIAAIKSALPDEKCNGKVTAKLAVELV